MLAFKQLFTFACIAKQFDACMCTKLKTEFTQVRKHIKWAAIDSSGNLER
jgi:hypothetical protein